MQAIMSHLYLRHKEDWERTRFSSFVTAQVNSSKPLRPVDLIRFPWDSETAVSVTTREDVERMRARAKALVESGAIS